jgi:hypothetical protein
MTSMDESLASVAPELQALVRDMDALVRQAVHGPGPGLESSLKWGNITYHPRGLPSRHVCALVAHRKHVNLQVWGGALIDDPAGLLAGTGKTMRHIRLEPGAALNRAAIAAIVRAALNAVASP